MRWKLPAPTTASPTVTPDRISTNSPAVAPSSTIRRSNRVSPVFTNTTGWLSMVCTAATGTISASRAQPWEPPHAREHVELQRPRRVGDDDAGLGAACLRVDDVGDVRHATVEGAVRVSIHAHDGIGAGADLRDVLLVDVRQHPDLAEVRHRKQFLRGFGDLTLRDVVLRDDAVERRPENRV